MANYNQIGANTKLGFKAGLQTDLDSYLKSGGLVEGVFYLTTDTHRLYIGRKNSADNKVYPVPVNQGILPVDSIEELGKIPDAHTGEFYYITRSNILCIRSGDNWIQINADTTLEEFSQQVEKKGNTAIITSTIKDSQGASINDSFTIAGSDYVSISVGDDGVITLSSVDNNTTNSSIEITPYKGSENESASAEDKKSGFLFKVIDSEEKSVSKQFDPQITYGSDKKITANFRNNILDLNIYTKDEVDNLFKASDAMIFKGVINSSEGIPTINVKNGYTYKIGQAFNDYKTGDLLIAVAAEGTTEDENGYLTNITWVHVPAGDEVYTKSFSASDNKWEIKEGDNSLISHQLIAAENSSISINSQTETDNSTLLTTTFDLVWGTF